MHITTSYIVTLAIISSTLPSYLLALFPHYQMERVTKLASEKPVVIFSKSSCCMSHTIKPFLRPRGLPPAVHELDEIPGGCEIEQTLLRLGCNPSVPAVFIGGELVGGANKIMSLHLNRSLIPMLRQVGALWV
ncbi:hypothetical protein CXB51_025612 [Gossypium anomalum]|uniref:Glutaredoxin domain-containing protein n=1 Tax=Gossypium anomalum TaxID=47600 RepID=A0A8J6CRR2_9ROSI|nr:hypothetical protein CXB51_025612 [Gossypium anomalum]